MKKVTAQRVIDTDRGVANGGQVYASVAALGPAVAISPPPTGLAVTANTIHLSAQTPMALISLLWYPPQAQTVRGYQLQVATDSGFTTNVEYFSTGSDTTTSLELITSAAGITYYIRVRVFAGNLISEWSSSVSVLAAADTTPAGIPTSLAYTWDGGDLLITWVNPSSTNLRDVEVRIWNSSGKTVLYHTGFSASQRYTWTLPQQRIDTSGSLDAAVYVELRSRTWSQVFGTSTAGISPTNSAPSAPASVALISSIGTLTISVSATVPTDFAAYRYRIIQTLPSAADVTFDSPSALTTFSIFTQATYQVGVKVLDVFGQLSSETPSGTSLIDNLTISALRANVIYSDSDGNSDATLHSPLSNGVLISGGITYATTSSWNTWIRAERPLIDRYRSVTLSMTPASGTSSWYLRLSSDGSTWSYYAGPVTGTRTLTSVADAAAAQAAAVSAATLGGQTTSRVDLPDTIEARFIEVWVRNAGPANTRVDEFYPRRVVESDDIVVQNLSSISANVGTITAGSITGVTITGATITTTNGYTTLTDNGIQLEASSTAGGLADVTTISNRLKYYYTPESFEVGGVWVQATRLGAPVNVYQNNMTIKVAKATQGGGTGAVILSADTTTATVRSSGVIDLTGTLNVGTSGTPKSANVAGGMNVGTATGAGTGEVATSGSAAFGAAINSAVRLFAKGIGTSSSTYCFNAQNSAGTNIIYCRDDGLSNFISSAWSSDERHKTELRAIDESDLIRFRALEPLQYIRTNGPGGPEYGLSAQRTRPIFPEMVIEDAEGYLSVRYNDFIPLLMAEVRILRARVETLEARAA